MILINIEIVEYIRISRSTMNKFETNFPYIQPNRVSNVCDTISFRVIYRYVCMCGSTEGLKQYKCQTVRSLN